MAAALKLSLKGRTALVTGAATGIGRAIALAFAQAGAAVVVNHLGRAAQANVLVQELQSFGVPAWALEADVSAAADVARLAAQVQTACGALDILVNNAGIIREKPFLETTEADWDRMLGTDLTSVFLTARAFLPAMVALESMSAESIQKELDIPQRRFAEPEEVAATALFLASDLSRFYCGQVLGPNGGSVMP
jgi:3-oxoacyl-[acyl-carrier protein] reductase